MSFPVWIPFENEWWTFCAFLALILGCVGGSDFTLKSGWIDPESIRKWVHLLVGIMVAASPLLFKTNLQPAILAIIFIILNGLALKKEEFKGIHSQERKTYGTLYFPIAYLCLVIGFWEYSEFIILSLAILAVSDPLAAQVGQTSEKPKPFTIWYDGKTVQGTIAFFISAFAIIYMGSQILYDHSNNYLLGLALFTACGATVAEITSCQGSDNISIPLVSMLFMIGYFRHVAEADNFFNLAVSNSSIVLFIVILLFSVAYQFNALSRSGYYGGMIMGVIISIMGSWRYLLPLAVFFILSSILSKALRNASFYRTKGSNRDIIQVYANGGVALFICIYDYLNPDPILFFLFLSSVTAAMSDTWATEFGKLSKKKPVSIITLLPMQHGLSGGITRIGTLGSLLGACLMGMLIWYALPMPSFIIYGIILSGFLAALIDSILGATVQGKYETQTGEIIEKPKAGALLISGHHWVTNDVVNLINTAAAPILMYIFLYLF